MALIADALVHGAATLDEALVAAAEADAGRVAGAPVAVEVARSERRLVVRARPTGPVDGLRLGHLAARLASIARANDPLVPVIDVAVRPPGAGRA